MRTYIGSTLTDTGQDTTGVTVIPKISFQIAGTPVYFANPGQTVTVIGSGFKAADISCQITNTTGPGPVLTAGRICNTGANGQLGTSSFVVANVTSGAYNVTVTGSPGADKASAILNVATGPTIAATPITGPIGMTVSVSGTGFSLLDSSSCTVTYTTAPGNGALYTSLSTPCTLATVGGSKQPSFTFTVAATAAASQNYLLRVTGSTSDYATANFVPLSAPSITLGPTTGAAGQTVTITSTTFSTLDVGPCNSIVSSDTRLFTSSNCAITSGGALTNTFFIVSNTAPGQLYTVTITGNKGDSASATFTVTASVRLTPTIGSPPVSGSPGTPVTVDGTGFKSSEGCFFTAPSGLVIASPTCSVNSNGVLSGSFSVGPGSFWSHVTSGWYSVNANGTLGDSASKFFTVQPKIALSPTSAPAGSTVSVSGAGFMNKTGTCVIPVATPVGGTPAPTCAQTSNGMITGSFNVTGTSGNYFVTVQNKSSGIPNAFAPFTITGGPIVTLTPNVGVTGQSLSLTGSGFSPADTSFTLNNTGGLFAFAPTCTLSQLTSGCPLTVKSNALGRIWTITVTGNTGDHSNVQFILQSQFALSPKNGGAGTTVALSGSGYAGQLSASNCLLSFTPFPKPLNASGIVCAIDSNGVLTGSFTVSTSAAAGAHTLTLANAVVVQGSVSDTFTVTSPIVSLSASSGTGGQTITVTGSAFSSGDSSCTITTMLWMQATPSCSVTGPGTFTGSFVVKTLYNGTGTSVVIVKGLLLDSANASFTVVPSITLSPSTNVRVGSFITISGSNFAFADAIKNCNITSSPVGAIFAGAKCKIDANYMVTGNFTLSPTASALSYVITVGGTGGSPPDSASATLTVMPHVVTLSRTAAPEGASVAVTGTGFSANDTCPASQLLGFFSSLYPVFGWSCSASSGTITGSFSVPYMSPGNYILTLVGAVSSGALYNDTGTANFVLTPGLSVLPGSGRAGIIVLVTGTNFNTADTGCAISSSPSGLISSPTCTVASGAMQGMFTVATGITVATLFSVQVTGTTGDTGSAPFTVPGAATLTLAPIAGPAGTAVAASGSGFVGTTCQMTSVPGNLFTSASCSLASGSLAAGSGFTVSATASVGTAYTVTVVTNLGASDSAFASFTVTAGPVGTLTVTPTSGPAGTVVTGRGTGFTADTICVLSAAPATILASASCTVTGGGNVTVGFTVSSSASAGSYAILAVGNTGKAASATFTVTTAGSRTFTLTPTSGRVGTVVTASGTNYAGTTCSLSSLPSGLLSVQSCSISGGTLNGGFTVASGAVAGGYSVTVTTGVSADTISASFTVPGATLTLSPSSGAAGATVTASGSNYAGTACTLTSSPTGLFTSQVCAISATGVLNGGFTVASDAPSRTYTVTATTPSESPSASFTVPPSTLTLNPNSGAVGTAVSISGTNYVGSTCSISSSPSGLIGSPTCLISSGILDGGFIVAAGAAVGTYTVTVTPSIPGGTSASATFTIPSPTGVTLSLSPTSGTVGTSVSVSGSGYTGTTCTLSSSPSLFTSSSCSVSGGTLSGTFSVATSASAGSYTVTVTTSAGTKSATFTVTGFVPPHCVIATATFGSEASPAVQLLRGFRDNLVLKTRAGSAFMDVFNAWYYSFSPSVAQFIASNDPIRAPARVILYPLLGVLSASAFTYSLFSASPEFAVVIAGLVASSLIGLIYLTPFTLVSMRALTRRKRINTISIAKASLLVLATALILLAAGELAGSFLILAVASSAIVLTCIIAAPVLAALAILRANLK